MKAKATVTATWSARGCWSVARTTAKWKEDYGMRRTTVVSEDALLTDPADKDRLSNKTRKKKKQAEAELGQAQPKLGLKT